MYICIYVYIYTYVHIYTYIYINIHPNISEVYPPANIPTMLVSDFHWVVVHHFGDLSGKPTTRQVEENLQAKEENLDYFHHNSRLWTGYQSPSSMSRVYKCIQSSWTMISKLQLPPAKKPLCTPQDVGRGMSWLTYHENWQLTPKITTFRSLRITKQSHHQIDPHSIYL